MFMAKPAYRRSSGYTLTEVLVVIAVIAIIAAILFPVFLSVREKGRRASCLSNERQLGMALFQYVQDNEQAFPGDRNRWARQTFPYVPSQDVFQCLDDSTPSHRFTGGVVVYPDSYGINSNIAGLTVSGKGGKPDQQVYPTATDPVVAAPAHTVLLFEVANDVASLTAFHDSAQSEGSASGDGAYACGGFINSVFVNTLPCGTGSEGIGSGGGSFQPLYATGSIGGRVLNGGFRDQARHNGGSNFIACDGHARWLRPEAVSGGSDAVAPDCSQGDAADQLGDCKAQDKHGAAGTANSNFSLTFSVR